MPATAAAKGAGVVVLMPRRSLSQSLPATTMTTPLIRVPGALVFLVHRPTGARTLGLPLLPPSVVIPATSIRGAPADSRLPAPATPSTAVEMVPTAQVSAPVVVVDRALLPPPMATMGAARLAAAAERTRERGGTAAAAMVTTASHRAAAGAVVSIWGEMPEREAVRSSVSRTRWSRVLLPRQRYRPRAMPSARQPPRLFPSARAVLRRPSVPRLPQPAARLPMRCSPALSHQLLLQQLVPHRLFTLRHNSPLPLRPQLGTPPPPQPARPFRPDRLLSRLDQPLRQRRWPTSHRSFTRPWPRL